MTNAYCVEHFTGVYANFIWFPFTTAPWRKVEVDHFIFQMGTKAQSGKSIFPKINEGSNQGFPAFFTSSSYLLKLKNHNGLETTKAHWHLRILRYHRKVAKLDQAPNNGNFLHAVCGSIGTTGEKASPKMEFAMWLGTQVIQIKK